MFGGFFSPFTVHILLICIGEYIFFFSPALCRTEKGATYKSVNCSEARHRYVAGKSAPSSPPAFDRQCTDNIAQKQRTILDTHHLRMTSYLHAVLFFMLKPFQVKLNIEETKSLCVIGLPITFKVASVNGFPSSSVSCEAATRVRRNK